MTAFHQVLSFVGLLIFPDLVLLYRGQTFISPDFFFHGPGSFEGQSYQGRKQWIPHPFMCYFSTDLMLHYYCCWYICRIPSCHHQNPSFYSTQRGTLAFLLIIESGHLFSEGSWISHPYFKGSMSNGAFPFLEKKLNTLTGTQQKLEDAVSKRQDAVSIRP